MKHDFYLHISCGHLFSAFGKLSIAFAFLLLAASPAMAEGAPSGGGSVLNILLLGVFAYFLVRMFRRRSGDNDNSRPGNWTRKDSTDDTQGGRVIRPMDRHEAARQMWGHLSSDKQDNAQVPSSTPTGDASFNEAEFIEGAKLFFSRLQQAGDVAEIEGLRGFLSDEAYAEAVAAIQSRPAGERVEIMLLNARIMEVKSDGGRTFASVFYDGQLRRGVSGDQTELLRTVWEFSRDDSAGESALWTLDKINKVDQ